VVLGAGLDTFAYRNPHAGLRVFEVDFPATQEWKRRMLGAHSISLPASLTFAPVDFERQTLADGLAAAGFDPTRPAFFSWLGVTMYLTDATVESTLAYVAGLPGVGITFDYAVPRSSLNFLERFAFDALSRRVARAGEPFLTFFDPAALHARLTKLGFQKIEDVGRDEINARYFSGRADRLRVSGRLGRIVTAEMASATSS
jgi:methyltransferase (TIGR00027 family)